MLSTTQRFAAGLSFDAAQRFAAGQRFAAAVVATLSIVTPLVAQTTISPTIRSTANIDDEDLDDIDFVEDLLDIGQAFLGGEGTAAPSSDPLTNDEDDEVTRILYRPVDLSGATSIELNFAWATTGGFDAGAEFSITALGVADPLFSVVGSALGDSTAAHANFFDSPVVDAIALTNAGVDLSSVEFLVLLDPGFDGDDETIFFDDLNVTFDTTPLPIDPPDDGTPDDGTPDDGTPDDGTPDDGPDDGVDESPGLIVPNPPAPDDDASGDSGLDFVSPFGITSPVIAPLTSEFSSFGTSFVVSSAIPEPTTLGLLIAGGLGLGPVRRRRR